MRPWHREDIRTVGDAVDTVERKERHIVAVLGWCAWGVWQIVLAVLFFTLGMRRRAHGRIARAMAALAMVRYPGEEQ